jgi:hypothetical protein
VQVFGLGEGLADQGRADDRALGVADQAAVGLGREGRLGDAGDGQRIGQAQQDR